MNEEKKYHKTKNMLIYLFLILLLIFVALICFIIIYGKMHPKKEYLSPDTIEIKEMLTTNFQLNGEKALYTDITNSTRFVVYDNEEEVDLTIVNSKIIKKDTNEVIQILVNGTNINTNIKLIYQTNKESYILTKDGNLYSLTSNEISENNILNVKKRNIGFTVKNIIEMYATTEDIYVLATDNRVLNVTTLEEYTGIINELIIDEGIVYIYADYSFSFEKGKIFTDEDGNKIRFSIFFADKLIDENAVIYDVDFKNNTLITSNMGKSVKVGYGKLDNEEYNINIETTTGIYKDIKSEYYYTR